MHYRDFNAGNVLIKWVKNVEQDRDEGKTIPVFADHYKTKVGPARRRGSRGLRPCYSEVSKRLRAAIKAAKNINDDAPRYRSTFLAREEPRPSSGTEMIPTSSMHA